MSTRHALHFENAPSITVAEGEYLSESMDVMNSPILFGCRTGICATCLVTVLAGAEHLPPMSEDEREVLELESDDPRCRLACQLQVTGEVTLAYVGK